MKPSLFLLAIFAAALLAAIPAHAECVLKPNDYLAICGDSITKQKRYSVLIEDYLLMCNPVPGLRVAQFGWSGEKYDGFLARAKNDILRFKPTVITINYGMNDGLYKPADPQNVEVFRGRCTQAAELFKASGVRTVVLASPGACDPDFNKKLADANYNETLAGLRDAVRDVAKKEGYVFADVHETMKTAQAKLKETNGKGYVFAGADGVHPTPVGHLAMAYAFIKALGCDGAIGTLTVDLASQQATGTAGQKIVSLQNGSLEVESTRYPFCFNAGGSESKNMTDLLPVLPFNEELNRYLLVVKGLHGTSAKITWGNTSKTFPVAALEKGINLAAEFTDNPFGPAFAKVDAAVREQQTAETGDMQKTIHPLMKETDQTVIDQTSKTVNDGDLTRFKTAAELVVPVHHILKIEPQS